MPDRFEKRLEHGPPVVTDGGMGVLVSSAVPGLRCPEEANIRAPESVVSLHASFINAGAELIETNTFGANRHKLSSQFLGDEVAAINETGVKLAREAREISGRDVYVAGSIGPLGELGGLAADKRGPVFAEQASLLEGRGVDLFMVETFFDLDELTTAIEAVQSVSSLPIVVLLTFDEDAETFGGVSARDAVERLSAYKLAAVGANHGAGLHAALAALEAMGNGRPLAALPNVGLASLSGGRVIYPHATPEYFAEFAAQARALGARVIGGCCGTTPTEIAAIARAVQEERQPTAPFAAAERELVVAAHERPEETELARKLRAGDRADGRDRDRAHMRDRDDSARDAPGHIRDGPAVAAARRPCRGCPQRPRRHGRSPPRRRLSGLARRLRGRFDRARESGDAPERRRGLQRQGDPRAYVVLPGRRRQPVGGRPRDRARPLPPEGRGRRQVRDDPSPLRPRLPRPLRRARRRLADSDPCRHLHGAIAPARRPAPQ